MKGENEIKMEGNKQKVRKEGRQAWKTLKK
jgi:hypothetical protein